MEPKWFYYFNKSDKESLLNYYTNIEKDNVLICQQLKSRRYTIFKNFATFSNYFDKTPEEERCFYEMIRADEARKPYFDIDIEEDFDFDIVKMVTIIKKLLEEKIKILVFTSHNEKKKSFHIVVDNVCFKNFKELEMFYEKVTEELSEKEKSFVDKSVYKSVQQFRIVGSHKYGKNNTKILNEELSYNLKIPKNIETNEKGKFNYKLSISLITNNDYCKYITGYENISTKERISIRGTSCEGDVEDILRIFYADYSSDDFKFAECKENNGNLLIILKRLNPTYCKNCKRIHEQENPFIVTSGEFRNIYFYCRRGEKEKINSVFLGSLGIPAIKDLTMDDIPVISEIDPYSDDVIPEPKIFDIEKKLEELSSKKLETPKRTKSRKSILNSIKVSNLVHN